MKPKAVWWRKLKQGNELVGEYISNKPQRHTHKHAHNEDKTHTHARHRDTWVNTHTHGHVIYHLSHRMLMLRKRRKTETKSVKKTWNAVLVGEGNICSNHVFFPDDVAILECECILECTDHTRHLTFSWWKKKGMRIHVKSSIFP